MSFSLIPFWALTVICWVTGHDDIEYVVTCHRPDFSEGRLTRQVCSRCRRAAP